MNYYIKNAFVVNEGSIQKRDLAIVDGKISLSPNTLPADVTTIDAEGAYLLPGIIDTHVHFRDGGNGENPAGDFATESLAARAGGVTSVIDMPNTNPQTISLQLLEQKEAMAAEKSHVNYGFMIGATNDNIEHLLDLPPQRYAAIKLFLGSSTGNMLVNDPEKLDILFQKTRKLIVAHCEEESVVMANMHNYMLEFQGTVNETASLHPKVRNTEACFLSTYKAIERARKYRTPLHIAHISSATELDLLSNQSLDVKHITAEVTPNHLWFDDRDYEAMGNLIKCNPSIKSNDDRLALWAALYDERIDTIATDHAPHPLANKQKPYFDAPSGIPSIQHSLQMMLETFFNQSVDAEQREELLASWLPLLVTKMCHNPATLFNIAQRGFIREGYHADLVLVRPAPEGVEVTLDSLLYKCAWSPLQGQVFHTVIDKVFVNGSLDNGPMPLCFEK